MSAMARIIGDYGLDIHRQVIDPATSNNADEIARDRRAASRLDTREREVERPRARGVEVAANASTDELDTALERRIGENDIVGTWWLDAGRKAASAVARISTLRGSATGFLISENLMMTNHHVFDSAEQASDPDNELNFTLERREFQREAAGEGVARPRHSVRSERGARFRDRRRQETSGRPVSGRGVRPCPRGLLLGKTVVGTPLNIVQHPNGEPKKVAFRNNVMNAVKGKNFVVYLTDTDPGSSGSPVFNDRWQLVALHHLSQPKLNEDGQPIDINGKLVTKSTPEYLRVWVANEGIRISSIASHLSRRKLPETYVGLLRNANLVELITRTNQGDRNGSQALTTSFMVAVRLSYAPGSSRPGDSRHSSSTRSCANSSQVSPRSGPRQPSVDTGERDDLPVLRNAVAKKIATFEKKGGKVPTWRWQSKRM